MTSAGPSAPGSQGGRYASVQANRARFSVAVPSTASFDRLLPAAKAISLAQAGQRRDPCPKPPGIWRMSAEYNGFKRLKPEAETLLTGLVRPVKDYRHPRESEAPEHPQGPAAPGFRLFAGMTDETDYPLIWRGSYSRLALVCRAMAQLVPIVEPLPDLALKAAFAGAVETAPRDAVREIVLAGEPLLGGVVVDIAFAIAEVAHQPGRRVQDVHRRHQRAGLVRHPA